jgi:molecular chaperone GrpE
MRLPTDEDDDLGLPAGASAGDDVEILEVVGVEEESSTFGIPRIVPPPEAETGPPAEIVLGFDDEPAVEPASARAGGATDRELLLRMRADYDNLRKRIDRERQDYEQYANSTLVARLLPILDNFERALAVEAPARSLEVLREGLLMIYRQLNDELRREGLRAIEALGKPFDPQLHDAVATDAASPHPPNTVVEELQRGYLFQDRVLRPAMVRVSTDGSRGADPDGSGEPS